METFEAVPGDAVSVTEFYQRLLGPGLGSVTNATEHECSPDGGRALVTGAIYEDLRSVPATRLQVLDLRSGEMRPLTAAPGRERLGRWSPEGDRIAYLCSGAGGLTSLWVMRDGEGASAVEYPIPHHAAEHLEWFPDGRRILVLAAEEGAAMGVLDGSGRLGAASSEGTESWRPEVRQSGEESRGWRRAFVVELEERSHRPVSPHGVNVWEACLAGEALLAVVSPQSEEGSWVGARVGLISLEDGMARDVYRPQAQLACPVACPGGERMALIEGIASDRGLVAGDLVLLDGKEAPRRLDTQGVDVTWIAFRDRDHLCFAGVRDTRTVLGELDLRQEAVELHLDGVATTSDPYLPRAAVVPGGGLLFTSAGWAQAPAVALADHGQLRVLRSLANPGTDWLCSQLGAIEEVSWQSPDGLRISGFLVRPRRGQPPYPTLLVVHGGPVACSRAEWPGLTQRINFALFSACGLALFLPNPRGSTGRGQDFVARELGDYGGAEADDLLSGLDHLVAQGSSDPERLAVFGVSHGGYMSCWLTTRSQRFRAAVAGSPVTDWYSQHFGSNIPEFDQMFLRASPREPGGAYFERSPVFFAHRSTTPTLLSAGLQDRCTPPGQAEEFHQALVAAGTPSSLLIYPEEGHGIRRLAAIIDFGTRVTGHLDRYLRLSA